MHQIRCEGVRFKHALCIQLSGRGEGVRIWNSSVPRDTNSHEKRPISRAQRVVLFNERKSLLQNDAVDCDLLACLHHKAVAAARQA